MKNYPIRNFLDGRRKIFSRIPVDKRGFQPGESLARVSDRSSFRANQNYSDICI